MAGVRNPNTDPWTDARVSELRRLKAKGYSAAQIAKALGGTTRCAVVSKLHQQGLTRANGKAKDPSISDNSTNQGVKTKLLAVDLSPAELLRPRRFSWEQAAE